MVNERGIALVKRFMRAKITSFCKELAHDVSRIVPHLLRLQANEEYVLP